MKIKYSSLILSLSSLIMIGCATPSNIPFSIHNETQGICNSEPEWVSNPPKNINKIYGVGIAPPNFKGISAQRKSAISKAVNEIAAQLNTTVNSQTMSSSSVYNHSANHSMKTVSFQAVNGQKVSSKIIKSCKNPNNDYLYILMEANRISK